MNDSKPVKQPVLKFFFGGWILTGGIMMIIMMLPHFIYANRSYIEPARSIIVAVVGIVFILIGLRLTFGVYKKRIKNGIPVKKALFIIPAVFLAISLITILASFGTVKNSYKPVGLKEAQSKDMDKLLDVEDLVSDISLDVVGDEPSSTETWVAVRIPGYEEGGDYPSAVAWSDAQWFAIGSWMDAKPVKKDIDDLDVIVLCRYEITSASYSNTTGGGGGGTGTSEMVYLYFVNAETNEVYRTERMGHELPSSVTSVPHYEVTADDLASGITNFLSK
ncbi:MAG: hypothetical protein IKT14_05850 [Clostridiales bacterium]|nr:hypothetical protein [Clostridiales bacterium]